MIDISKDSPVKQQNDANFLTTLGASGELLTLLKALLPAHFFFQNRKL